MVEGLGREVCWKSSFSPTSGSTLGGTIFPLQEWRAVLVVPILVVCGNFRAKIRDKHRPQLQEKKTIDHPDVPPTQPWLLREVEDQSEGVSSVV